MTHCYTAPQASAKWRLFWRLAPGLYKRMSAWSLLTAMYIPTRVVTRRVRA